MFLLLYFANVTHKREDVQLQQAITNVTHKREDIQLQQAIANALYFYSVQGKKVKTAK